METPPEATPNNRQATQPPAADTRVQRVTHAVELAKTPASSRKRAPSEALVDIKVEEDDDVFRKPFAPASHPAKRPKAGHLGQTDFSRPDLPLTPFGNRSQLQNSTSPRIAVGGPLQTNASPLTPLFSRQAYRAGTFSSNIYHDSTCDSNSEMSEGENSPQIVLQSVESDDIQLDEDDISTSSELMRQIQFNTSTQQHFGGNPVEEQFTQSAKKNAHTKSPAPEESDSDDDASENWRREQIMLNAVLKARDEFSLLPSSWKVHFSGGPSTDRMFYRRVKARSFRPRIYAHCEKYEITGTYMPSLVFWARMSVTDTVTGAHNLRNMMQMSSRIRDLRIAQGKVARDRTRQQAARDADQARLSKAIAKKIHKLLTDAIHWSKVDGGLDVFGDELPPNVAILHVSAGISITEAQAKMDDHMEKLAQIWRDRFASLGPPPSSETASPPLEPVLYAFIIMNHLVLIATKNAATPNAPIHIPVRIDMEKPLQQSWNALGLMVTICWARDKLMEAAAALQLDAQDARKEESDPDA